MIHKHIAVYFLCFLGITAMATAKETATSAENTLRTQLGAAETATVVKTAVADAVDAGVPAETILVVAEEILQGELLIAKTVVQIEAAIARARAAGLSPARIVEHARTSEVSNPFMRTVSVTVGGSGTTGRRGISVVSTSGSQSHTGLTYN